MAAKIQNSHMSSKPYFTAKFTNFNARQITAGTINTTSRSRANELTALP